MSMNNGDRFVRPSYFRESLKTVIEGESKTQQSHKNSVDVNTIVKKFDRTGVMPPALREPQYGDVSDLNADYGELIERSREALDTVGRYIEEKAALDSKALADQAAKDKADLDEFRNMKKSPPPSLTS